MITDSQITKLQTLHKKTFGEVISKEQAISNGTNLVRLVELIYRRKVKNGYENKKQQN